MSKVKQGEAYVNLLCGAVMYLYGEYSYYQERLQFKDVFGYVVKLANDVQYYYSENNGKLVYFTGNAFGTESPSDDQSTFKFQLPRDTVALDRVVMIYQHKSSGKTSRTDWFENIVDPTVIRSPFSLESMRSQRFSSPINVGPFWLSKFLISQIPATTDMNSLVDLPKEIGLHVDSISANSDTISKDTQQSQTIWFRLAENGWYYQTNNLGTPSQPLMGDVKMTYKYVPGDTPVSILARQEGPNLTSFQSPVGRSIEKLHPGKLTLDEFIDESIQHMTWRFVKWGGIGMMGLSGVMIGYNKVFANSVGAVLVGGWIGTRVLHLVRFGRLLLPTTGIAAGSEVVYRTSKNSNNKN